MSAVTQWFSGDEMPVRDGVYERKYGNDIFYCQFRNLFWRTGSRDVELAARYSDFSDFQDLPWRGLAEKP